MTPAMNTVSYISSKNTTEKSESTTDIPKSVKGKTPEKVQHARDKKSLNHWRKTAIARNSIIIDQKKTIEDIKASRELHKKKNKYLITENEKLSSSIIPLKEKCLEEKMR